MGARTRAVAPVVHVCVCAVLVQSVSWGRAVVTVLDKKRVCGVFFFGGGLLMTNPFKITLQDDPALIPNSFPI